MMTFEEYRHRAENPPFPNRPAIFKIVAYSLDEDNLKKYYRNKLIIYDDFESYHTTFDEAEDFLHAHAKKLGEKMYCAYIYQLPLGRDTYGQYDRVWMYDHTGKLIDQSYCSNTFDRDSAEGVFRGRPESAMRFKQGDIAEWFRGHEIEFVMIIHTPYTIKEGYERYERIFKEYGEDVGLNMDFSDDCCYAVVGPGTEWHCHPHTLNLLKPRFEIPKKIADKLNNALIKTLEELEAYNS